MQREITITEGPMAAGRITLTAVVKISLKWWNIRGSTSFYVTKQPVFLIVTDAEKSRAFSVTGEEVSLDSLETQYPELSFIKEAG